MSVPATTTGCLPLNVVRSSDAVNSDSAAMACPKGRLPASALRLTTGSTDDYASGALGVEAASTEGGCASVSERYRRE